MIIAHKDLLDKKDDEDSSPRFGSSEGVLAFATDEFPTGQLISLESPSMAPVRLTLVVILRPPTTPDVDAIGYTLMIRAEVAP